VKRGRAWDVTWYERALAVPAVVAELRALVAAGASRDELAAAIRAGGGYREAAVGEGEVPILDPGTGERLAALGVATADGAPLGRGDRLLLDWCAEALAPLFTR
jgi:hypothetical protein